MSIGEYIFIGLFIFIAGLFIGATAMEYVEKRRYEEESKSLLSRYKHKEEEIQMWKEECEKKALDFATFKYAYEKNEIEKIKMLKLQIYELIRDKKER